MSLNDNASRAFAVEYKGRPVGVRATRTVAPLNALRREAEKVFGAAKISEPWLPEGVEYRLDGSRTVDLQTFLDFPDNPQQRDVLQRIVKGRANHLYRLDEAHRKATVAILPDGSTYKVDGHTRSEVWRRGMSDRAPDTVVIDIYRCRDVSAVKALYDKFDNPDAGETGPDRVTGATRDAGVRFDSAIMQTGEYSTAIRELWHYIEKTRPAKGDKQEIISLGVKRFMSELKAIDRIAPPRKRFPSCVFFAAIASIRALGDDAVGFWTAYANDKGAKTDGQRDAVVVFEARIAEVLKGGNYGKGVEAAKEAIGAIKAYSKGTLFTERRGYTSVDSHTLRSTIAKAFGGK